MSSRIEYAMPKRRGCTRWALTLLAVHALGLPQSANADPVGTGLQVGPGPIRAYPALDVEFTYHSNYLRSNDDLTPNMGTWVSIVTPSVRLNTLKGPDAYNLSYSAAIGTVSADNAYGYVNQTVSADANWEFGSKHRLRADYQFFHWADRPGSGDPSTVSAPNFTDEHPDVWMANRFRLGYSYGRPSAKGRLDLTAGWTPRRYLNNDQELRDNNRSLLEGAFFWRIQPHTSLVLSANWQDIDYINQASQSELDSTEWRLYAGATWDATAKTTGTVKVGYLAKDFVLPIYEDYSGLGWEASLQWRARTYSIFNLVTSRNPSESTNNGADGTNPTRYPTGKTTAGADTVIVSAVGADWVHHWKSYLRSRLALAGTNDEYIATDRVDHRYLAGAGVFYQFKRWAEVGVEYRYETRTSNEALAEYEDNVFMLTLNARY